MYLLEEKIWFWLKALTICQSLFFINEFWKSRTQKKFITSSLLIRLSPNLSKFKPYLKISISSIIITLAPFSKSKVNW